jgi:lysophospholipase L1-like esterase
MKRTESEALTRIAFIILALLVAGVSRADPIETYLALGDSIAFGVTNVIPVSFGDQGYVRLYADFLATQANGMRPHVVNLAIPGETSTSFFTAVSPPGYAPHDLLASVNLNYHGAGSLSQDALLLNTLAAEATTGRVITNVSFAIGDNDLLAFEALHPDFFSLPPAEQQQLISTFFAVLSDNYVLALSQVRSALPDARILLLNYYNPLGGFPPDDPFNIANIIFDQGQTSLITGLAGPFHASVVDINPAFRGYENELTYIASGDGHPTPQGYAVIAQQMASASVPEPATVSLMAAGIGLLAVLSGRKHIRALRPTNRNGVPRFVK